MLNENFGCSHAGMIVQTFFFLSLYFFQFLNALQSDNKIITVFVLGHKCLRPFSESF